MSYETLKFEINNGVGTITLNRPDAANAINIPMAKDLLKVAIECESGAPVRVLLLKGEGKLFCAGGDLKFISELDNLRAGLAEMLGYLHSALGKIDHLDAPLIGAITGTAAGAGLSLVSACDLAIAGESVNFTMAYTAAGLTPDASSTFHLPRSIGKKRTMELMLTNRVLSAKEGVKWGLINLVVADDQVIEESEKLARKIAEGPTRAYAGVKEMLRQSFSNGLETQMELESQIFANQLKGQDGPEGIKAFMEKRKPEFKGK
tara:strand:- start:1313 stop:2098 length:786 start_codon:yes stop_codon:yes gene_type:complete